MNDPQMIRTLGGMLDKLKGMVQQRNELQAQITDYSDAIRGLARIIEDEDIKASYLLAVDELSGKPSFMGAIRTALRTGRGEAFTAGKIQAAIKVLKIMNLSAYSNPLASIHTTLRRMVESEEVEACINKKGEKAYRLTAKK